MAIVADRITFRAGLADDVALAEVPVLQTSAPERFGASNPITVQDHLRDAALLRLAKPVPTSLADPFVVASPGTGDEVSVVFHAQGREDARSWQRICDVLGRQDGFIAVDCV